MRALPLLVRIQDNALDKKRAELQALHLQLEDRVRVQNILDDNLNEAYARMAENPSQAGAYDAFCTHQSNLKVQNEHNVQRLQKDIAAAQNALSELFCVKKRYERVQTNCEMQKHQKTTRAEQRAWDETCAIKKEAGDEVRPLFGL